MVLIVGLGNPGAKYARTRHNVGFDVVEILAARNQIELNRTRCKAKVGEGRIGNVRVALAQPQTYMNLSGEAVTQLVNWYKVAPEELLVVYDDVDLPFGRVRIRPKGSAGTHNGDVYKRQSPLIEQPPAPMKCTRLPTKFFRFMPTCTAPSMPIRYYTLCNVKLSRGIAWKSGAVVLKMQFAGGFYPGEMEKPTYYAV